MENEYYANFLEKIVHEDDKSLLVMLATAIRCWKNFSLLEDLRLAYNHLNKGRSNHARNIVQGVIKELQQKKAQWSAEEILRREG